MSGEEGLQKAVAFLKDVMIEKPRGAMWWDRFWRFSRPTRSCAIKGEKNEDWCKHIPFRVWPFTNHTIRSFKQIKDIGFDGVEISYENKGDFDPKTVAKALKDNGLECCSICGAYGPGRDLRGSKEEQDTSKQYIKDCIDACAILGSTIYCGPHYSRVGEILDGNP